MRKLPTLHIMCHHDEKPHCDYFVILCVCYFQTLENKYTNGPDLEVIIGTDGVLQNIVQKIRVSFQMKMKRTFCTRYCKCLALICYFPSLRNHWRWLLMQQKCTHTCLSAFDSSIRRTRAWMWMRCASKIKVTHRRNINIIF